jgi:hypothetical protein
MEHEAKRDQPSRMVRLSLDMQTHARLRHLALDLGLTLGQLMREAAALTLRYHDRGDGLAEPKSRWAEPRP